MSINALLSTVILVSFIVTLVLAVGSYLAYKLRDRGRVPTVRGEAAGERGSPPDPFAPAHGIRPCSCAASVNRNAFGSP